MNTLKVPYIEGIEKMSFGEMDLAMETGGCKSVIGHAEWKEYPYRPDVTFSVARSSTHLAVLYHVRGLDLRAAATGDNGNVWEDSCCEMFISDPSDGTYYNFEMNCTGTLLAAKRASRESARHFGPEELSQITRHSTIPKGLIEINGTVFSWSIGMCVPFRLIGVNPEHLPVSLRANFYKCADKSAHPHFLSWNPVEVPSPDFHRPEFFGELVF